MRYLWIIAAVLFSGLGTAPGQDTYNRFHHNLPDERIARPLPQPSPMKMDIGWTPLNPVVEIDRRVPIFLILGSTAALPSSHLQRGYGTRTYRFGDPPQTDRLMGMEWTLGCNPGDKYTIRLDVAVHQFLDTYTCLSRYVVSGAVRRDYGKVQP